MANEANNKADLISFVLVRMHERAWKSEETEMKTCARGEKAIVEIFSRR